MSEYNKNEMEALNSQQLQVLYNVLEELGFREKEVIIETLGKPGDNFASEVKVTKVKISDDEIFRIIMKKPAMFAGPNNTMSTFSHILFNNEIIMYTEVLKLMTQIQISAGVKERDLFKYANCYGAIGEPSNELILLEDLSKENYVILDKLEPMSNDTIKMVLSNLATYHSLSYALKDKYPERFLEFSEKLVDIQTLEENKQNAPSFVALGDNFSNLFTENKYKYVVKQVLTEQFDKTIKLVEADKRSKYSIIVHGDCWTNNMLFQIKNGVPNNCVLIDYQIARESLPVSDILYMIFNCSDYKLRSEYYNDWIDHYHSELEKNLFTYGLRVNSIYPRDKFDTDLRRYCKIYLGMAIITNAMLLRETSESVAIKESMTEANNTEDMLEAMKLTENLNVTTISKIKNRIGGLIDTCIELGYINVSGF